MDELTTEMMEHICDNLCKYPISEGQTQDELDDICTDCEMGKFVCNILNLHNRTINEAARGSSQEEKR